MNSLLSLTESPTSLAALALVLLLLQVPAIALLLSRLIRGPVRHPPLQPQSPQPDDLGTVSVVVPTLNEAHRLPPCLTGLTQQSYEVREILVVDSHSQDGTPELVKAAAERDPRFRLLQDDPLPGDWVGRPWALHTGFLSSAPESEWVLGIDADTQPLPGLVASLLLTAEQQGYDLISLAPQFVLKLPGELWLQPALLMTLVYRFGAAGDRSDDPARVMANGQCFLCRRSLLVQLNGYTEARRSFCDDVTLARYAAAQGAHVAFLDGTQVLQVRMYEGAKETWEEWGRSLDLKDAATPGQIWSDLWLLTMVQGLPWPIVLCWLTLGQHSLTETILLNVNLGLVASRCALLLAIRPAYDLRQAAKAWIFWLSPLADPLAVLRIWLSSLRTPSQWRGRVYKLDK